MPPLTWDEVGERLYETGVDHGVLYLPDAAQVYITSALLGMVLRLLPNRRPVLSLLHSMQIISSI